MRKVSTAGRRALLLLPIAASLSGCVLWMPDLIHGELGPASAEDAEACLRATASDDEKPFFGVALSGGGSRAAVYTAAGLEALWEHGLLDEPSHLSSVSGGSMALTYFQTHRGRCDAAAEESAHACWVEFFAGFKQAMEKDLIPDVLLRQFIFPIRWLSPTRRSKSFQEVVDREYLNGARFADLPSGKDAPAVFLNASSYDDGWRFVFSNRCMENAEQELPPRYQHLRSRSFSREGCPRTTPEDMPLSVALSASAAFPGAFGPVAFEVPASCDEPGVEWWHIGDGGIIDNTGMDALEEAALRRASRKGVPERAAILALDAGRAPKADELVGLRFYKLFTRDPGRIVGVAKVRGDVYHDLVWEEIDQQLASDGFDLARFRLRFDDANVPEWPASCGDERATYESEGILDPAEGIRKRFQVIPTSFGISDCDADLVEQAAHAMVHEALNGGEAGRRLRESGFPLREFRH